MLESKPGGTATYYITSAPAYIAEDRSFSGAAKSFQYIYQCPRTTLPAVGWFEFARHEGDDK